MLLHIPDVLPPGQVAQARALLDRLCDLANDVGLLSEEYDPLNQHMVGNFPQAFSHVGLVSSAVNLARAGKDRP